MSIITRRENLKVFLLDDDFVCIYCFTVHVCEYDLTPLVSQQHGAGGVSGPIVSFSAWIQVVPEHRRPLEKHGHMTLRQITEKRRPRLPACFSVWFIKQTCFCDDDDDEESE